MALFFWRPPVSDEPVLRGELKNKKIKPTKLINAAPQSPHLTVLWLPLRKQLRVVVVVDASRYKDRQAGRSRQLPGAAA